MDNFDYVVLTDSKHNGVIVKGNGSKQFRYDRKTKEWIRTGIFMDYCFEESPLYNQYKEISEKEALEMIEAS